MSYFVLGMATMLLVVCAGLALEARVAARRTRQRIAESWESIRRLEDALKDPDA